MNIDAQAHDVYVGCHGDLTGYGGAMIAGRGLAAACEKAGLCAMLLGVGDRQPQTNTTPEGGSRRNIRVSPSKLLWRVHNWRIPRLLEKELSRMPRPRVGLVSFSAFWTVAAKRAWPDLPVIARYCGLLSNCAPLTRPRDQTFGFWYKIRSASTRSAERAAMKLADLVLVPAREHADEIAALVPSIVGKWLESPDGCEQIDFDDDARSRTRAALGVSPNDFLVLSCGSLDRNKAVDHAVRELKSADPRIRLALIGDGPDREKVEALTRRLDLAERVYFLGRVPKLSDYYAAADCVISTSFYDTFPNVIKEAMWCGKPVVVPRHDPPRIYAGISGLVRRRECGLSYDRLAAGALAARLNELCADRMTATELGNRARAVARALFRWDDTVEHLRRLAGLSPACINPPGKTRTNRTFELEEQTV